MGDAFFLAKGSVEVFGEEGCGRYHEGIAGTHDPSQQGCDEYSQQTDREKLPGHIAVNAVGMDRIQLHALLNVQSQSPDSGEAPGYRANALDEGAGHVADASFHFRFSSGRIPHGAGESDDADNDLDG